MEQYYLALNPEKRLADLVNEQKQLVQETVGKQKYLQDPPHSTLTIFTTDDLEGVIRSMEELTRTMQRIRAGIGDLHVFYNDPWTKGHTITYSYAQGHLAQLRQTQLQVVNAVDRFNTKGFNYPYLGDGWIPHITLASIEPEKFDLIFDKIKQNPIQGEFSIDAINLYRIGNETSFLIKSFELR